MKTEGSEFYIGWQPEAPDGISRRVRHFILTVCIIVPVVGALLVLNQVGFADSSFEYGQPTALSGALVKTPAPFLQVFRGKDLNGKPVYQNILLVSPGKHGVGEQLAAFEQKMGRSLEGTIVKLKGNLIYHDGKTLMEVEDCLEMLADNKGVGLENPPKLLGGGAFIGEITDPKCLFGAMKPGYGKPHRSCAARCIAGGIPPVLKTLSTNGKVRYYLLAGEDGGALNEEVLPFVGDQVVVCGSVKKMGDWLVIFKDAGKPLGLAPEGLELGVPMCK